MNGGAAWIFGGLVIVANPETLDALENQNLTPDKLLEDVVQTYLTLLVYHVLN